MPSLDRYIVQRIANDAGARLTRKLVRRLQSMAAALRVDDGARNLWEEICIQARQDSVWWNQYEAYIEACLRPLLVDLSDVERVSVWLCVGDCYFYEERALIGRIDSALSAIDDDELVQHVIREHVAHEAMNYENKFLRSINI